MSKLLSGFVCVFSAVIILSAVIPAYSVRYSRITGCVELGYTKQAVMKKMGKPDSPQRFDFFYVRDKSEVIVCFDDKTRIAEAVIIRGAEPNYSIEGIKVGDLKTTVKKAFGAPERIVNYMKSGVECWYYPSKNVNFAFTKDKISSFSISDVNVGQ